MEYAVNYSCGHAGTVQLFGPEKERRRKLDWMQRSGLCPACYRASRIEAAADESALRDRITKAMIERYPDQDAIQIAQKVSDAGAETLQRLSAALGVK